MSKKLFIILTAIMIVSRVAGAGWLNSVETNFSDTVYVWTNTSYGMVDIESISFVHDSAIPNTVTVYRVDLNAKEYNLQVVTNSALLSFILTPSGNGKIRIPKNESLKIVQGATANVNIVLDLEKPE